MTVGENVLDRDEIAAWINASVHQLDQRLTGQVRAEVVAAMRRDTGAARAPFQLLAALALLDDCLRVAHLAIEADGVSEDVEIARALPLAAAAAPRYFAVLEGYVAFGEVEPSAEEAAAFLRHHHDDAGAFGNRAPGAWHGLALCRRTAERTGDDAPMRAHERMLVQIMDAVFAGRDSAIERRARDNLHALFEGRATDGADSRVAAYCRADGPEVFSGVAHGSQIFERDPFDVATIHADAREGFQRLLEHAITPTLHGAAGRTLLVLGTAGSGKTHLLRAFRATVHEGRLGYAGYLQMSSDVGDYARYVLAKLVDSLERPYCAPELAESSLLYLSDGLAERFGVLPADALAGLRSGDLDAAELERFVGQLVDRLVRTPELREVDSDLVHALLLLQRRDPALQRRVVKYLRCEALTGYEQQLLGGLAPRIQPEDPERMIVQLGKLAYELQQAALVLLVDQVEDAIPDARGHERVQRAIDVVRRVADTLPSAVVVIACLEDVYDHIRPKLVQSVLDRLERDPPPVRLSGRRSREEVEAMLVRRLAFLYDALDVPWREDDPLFPFRAAHVDELANQRARDCLAFFRKHREQCVAAGTIVEPGVAAPERVPRGRPTSFDELERAWNDALVAGPTPPDDEGGLLRLVENGARACAAEAGAGLVATYQSTPRPRLTLAWPGRAERVVEVCNRQAQGGRLGAQIEALSGALSRGQVGVALRTSEFTFGPRTQVARLVGELIAKGGLALSVEDGDLRAVAAFETFAAAHGRRDGFATWSAQSRPLGRLALFRALLELDRAEPRAAATSAAPPPAAPPPPTPPPAAASAKPASPPARRAAPAAPSPTQLLLGVTPTMRAEPVAIAVESLKVHAAVLGTTGSGKTTTALRIVEQVLERGMSVLLVDRKGDLARYASRAWWDDVPADAEAARRKAALRERIVVDLYTPGEPAGRPLRIPVVPGGMAEMTTQERDQVAKTAASGLGAMIGYRQSESHRRREAILKKAIELHADTAGATLEDLRETIARPDPELLAAVGNLTRHFSAVAEDLDMLAIQRGNLLSGDGEVLDVHTMLEPRDGKARLAIVSAVALGDVSILQFFVSRLLVELGRMVRRHPSPTLRAVAFFDEADTYIPATSSPPTKEPMFDLLRRARSGGLGVMLATQNPGDLDYKARDNIATWLVGRVAQDRAIEKMRNLLAGYPNVATRLAGQATGAFFLLNPGGTVPARELRADQALMRTEQLQEQEIAALARETLR